MVMATARSFTRPSFIDYLRSGWQMTLVAAIDYTSSNGEPAQKHSLHFLGKKPNMYQNALQNVGEIVEAYGHKKTIPVFGFGGIPRHLKLNSVSHCFAINGSKDNPHITGIQNVVNTYKHTLPKIGLGGPTLFVPLLQEFE